MASRVPFSFTDSKLVAPVICLGCGSNAHCYRRAPQGKDEIQFFFCMECGWETNKVRGIEASDHEVEKTAEQQVGVAHEPEKNLDGSRRLDTYRGWLESKFAKADGKTEADQRRDTDTSKPTANTLGKG
jgi:hypothetical protein